ncbi:unnamed protein product [Oppiella nova]|uniref:Fatty acid desaturase domain-containing protein n=1 Tax=Oppiella nova TaxID=334625 RepID=A0A7R9QFG7_9ACAR|nr:unnamed protein product [Oppiella nova]CAG2163957.1 unnamed protein product [Oppiella nova]
MSSKCELKRLQESGDEINNNVIITTPSKRTSSDTPAKCDDSVTHRSFIIKSYAKSNVRYIYYTNGSIVWRNCFLFFVLHLVYFFSYYVCLANKCWYTWIFGYWYGLAGGLGVTAGAHRLWSHRSYKARLPLRILLMVFHSIAGQNDLYEWCRDHRVHHKYSETDADPHNSRRGFFFAHVGWLLTRKHPDVLIKGKQLDCQDILNDPVVWVQKKYYPLFFLAFCFVLPTMIPVYFWSETWFNSLIVGVLWRYCTALHCTWFVNSAAHMFGDKPYNPRIEPRENPFVSFGAFGEGFHNYHHEFPFDYKTSEMGWKLNVTTVFIDFMAFIGQAYDRKQLSQKMIDERKLKVAENSFKYLLPFALLSHPSHPFPYPYPKSQMWYKCVIFFMEISGQEPEITDIIDGIKGPKREFKVEIVWRNVAIMSGLHLAALYGFYLCFGSAHWQTIAFAVFLYVISGLGITAGAHRLWSHRAYKAKWPLRVILCIFNTIAFQNSIYEWSRDHRVHHKYSETDADPHNANRGFFFAHCGWLLCRKHPDVIEKGRNVSCEDLLQDPLVSSHTSVGFSPENIPMSSLKANNSTVRIYSTIRSYGYYPLFFLAFCFVLPTMIPVYFWSETWSNSLIVGVLWRYCTALHCTWFVNSAAHMFGDKPYNPRIEPRENPFVSFGAFGEGMCRLNLLF